MHWRACPGFDTGVIQPGEHVAIKCTHTNSGGGRFAPCTTRREVEAAGEAYLTSHLAAAVQHSSPGSQCNFLCAHQAAW